MSTYNCGVCGHLLYDINEKCPMCLPDHSHVHYGGFRISMYICPNHPNESWDTGITSYDGAPYCIPCEILKLRIENRKLLEELSDVNYCCVHLRDEIKELKKKDLESSTVTNNLTGVK